MAKPRRKPESVSGSRRQTARTHFVCWLVRTHRDRKNFGDPRAPHPSESARRNKVGKSYLVGSRGLWLPELSNLSGRHPSRRRSRGGLGPLCCYKKDENARTILSASKKPTQLHPNGGDPSKLLPPTDKIVWEWRYKICYAIGNDSSKYKLQEIQEIGEQRKISALSTRNREKDLAELRYASTVEEWKREKWQREEKRRKKRGGSGKGPRSGNFQPAKVRRGEEKNRSTKSGDSCSGDWHSVWGDTKGCGIASRQKMGCPRFSRQRRQSPGCIAAWKRRGSCCLGDKRFAKNLTRMCGLLPFGQERQLWLAAFLASVFLWFRKTWRVGVAHRTFEKFPKLGRKNLRVEPHPSGIQMRGVRSPS